jgi:hypothetical protein
LVCFMASPFCKVDRFGRELVEIHYTGFGWKWTTREKSG